MGWFKMKLFHYFRKNKSRNKICCYEIYDFEILSNDSPISNKQLTLLRFLLKFKPNKNNLKCLIRVYHDTLLSNIYCETTTKDWTAIPNEMIALSETLTRNTDLEEFSNLIDISDFYYEGTISDNLIQDKAIEFINYQKKDFQTNCTLRDTIFQILVVSITTK